MEVARAMAIELLARTKDDVNVGDMSDLVTECHGGMNAVYSFAILDCGSKSGWEADRAYRAALRDFTEWLYAAERRVTDESDDAEEGWAWNYDWFIARYGGDSVPMGMEYCEFAATKEEMLNDWWLQSE